MDLSPLALSTDSLIVAAGLSAVIAPRHIAPLAALFGIFDAAGSLVGPFVAVQTPLSGLIAPLVLFLWGVTVLLNLPILARIGRSSVWAYALPPLLAIDNLLVPNAGWATAGLVSTAMAAFGFGLGFVLFRGFASKLLGRRWIGAPLAFAGLLLAT